MSTLLVKPLAFIIFFSIVSTVLLADTVVLRDGVIHKGTILSATQDSIVFLSERDVFLFAKSDVLTIVFSNADVVDLTADRTLLCKVAAKVGDEVVVATPQGVQTFPNAEILNIHYNAGGELQVPSLPKTGPQFSNKPNRFIWAGDHKSNLFLRVHLAAHYASLAKWKEQFIITSGEGSPSSGLVFGGEAGFALPRLLQLGVGYEYFASRQIKVTNVSPTFTDRATATFLYATARMGGFLASTPELFVYGALDVGFLKGPESIEFSNGVNVDATGSTAAIRIKGGGEYFFSGNFSTTGELAYLSGKVSDVSELGHTVSGYELDYSGFSIIIALSYHIPVE